MKKILVIGFCLLLLISFVSANIFSNFFAKLTGQATTLEKKNSSLGIDTSSGDEKTLNYFSKNLDGYKFPYYSNRDLTKKNSLVKRVIIVIHGNGRDASGYFDSTLMAAEERGVLDETFIIAPSFKISSIKTVPDLLYWDGNSGWKVGDKSSTNLKSRFSSFEIVDLFVKELNDKSRFPNLQEIVVIGHSAGGQFVNRYAAGNSVDKAGKVSMRYVVANPSSYMYFDEGRMVAGKYIEYKETPFLKTNLFEMTCPAYNDYRYGLDDRNSYMKQTPSFSLKKQYESRKVTYLLGEDDVDPFDDDLDKSCAAELQGLNRKMRGDNYFKYLNEKLPGNKHKKLTVEDVGHSAKMMFNSPEGLQALFG